MRNFMKRFAVLCLVPILALAQVAGPPNPEVGAVNFAPALTTPAAGQVPVGNAAGTAYASKTLTGDATVASTGAVTVSKSNGFKLPVILQQTGLALIVPPSGFMTATGGIVIGQAPSSAATVSFSATSGAGVTMTFSAATLLGTAVDVGRVLTILDTTYKYAVITTQVSTTVATVTLTGTLSGTGPFANNTIWLSGGISTNAGTSNTTTFSVPLFIAYANAYLYFPPGTPIGGGGGMYFCQMASTTVATCFNNVLPANTLPTVIGSPTPFSGLTPAAYTQTTGSRVLTSASVPANSMGVNGMLIVDIDSIYPNTAGSKVTCVVLGSAGCTNNSNTTTTIARWQVRISNNGVANSQILTAAPTVYGTTGNAGPTIGRFTQDTSTTLSLQLFGGPSAATDFYVAEAYSMQEWPN